MATSQGTVTMEAGAEDETIDRAIMILATEVTEIGDTEECGNMMHD